MARKKPKAEKVVIDEIIDDVIDEVSEEVSEEVSAGVVNLTTKVFIKDGVNYPINTDLRTIENLTQQDIRVMIASGCVLVHPLTNKCI